MHNGHCGTKIHNVLPRLERLVITLTSPIFNARPVHVDIVDGPPFINVLDKNGNIRCSIDCIQLPLKAVGPHKRLTVDRDISLPGQVTAVQVESA